MIEKLESIITPSALGFGNLLSPPTNEQLMEKINQIIDHLNKPQHKTQAEISDLLTKNIED